jgi:hypothetical protein
MTKDEVIARLREARGGRRAIEAATGIKHRWMTHVACGTIKNPGSEQMDKLRSYFLSEDVRNGAPR